MTEVETSQGKVMVPYEVRRRKGARYIKLSIGNQNHAVLSVPERCPMAQAMEFLRSQGTWLEENLKEHPTRSSLTKYLQANPRLYGLGHVFQLTLQFTQVKPFYLYDTAAGEIVMRLRQGEDTEQELLVLCRGFASEVITARTLQLAKKWQLHVKRVTVRDQSSRWGSCSCKATISLNWRLVLLRPHLQDHIILHELAHLKEMNHGSRFWELLRRFDPRTDQHNSQLNPAAARLMPLGRVTAQ
ncbi:MAG: SprT family zinc-dependent metalloprotease [Verrucomicrobiota bacterium]